MATEYRCHCGAPLEEPEILLQASLADPQVEIRDGEVIPFECDCGRIIDCEVEVALHIPNDYAYGR